MRFKFSLPATLVLIFSLAASNAAGARASDAVDLNRASVAELMHVPGMTATWAARIVRFRPYRSKLDLLDQGVVPPEVYRRIRDGVVAHRLQETIPERVKPDGQR